MLPYQIYQALTDERTRDLVAAARRHEMLVADRYDSTDATESSSRLMDLIAQMVALFHIRRGVHPRSTVTSARASGSTMTSTSAAGPIGCSA